MDAIPSVVVVGAGGHALVVADILRLVGAYEIAAFVDDTAPERRGERFCSAPVYGGIDELAPLRAAGLRSGIVAIGQCAARMRIADALAGLGFDLATALHPDASIARDVAIGRGSVVVAQAAINPGAKIGDNVIINTGATVDHECEIGAGTHIGPGVHLAGRVRVGTGVWIGIGSTVIDRVRIGDGAFIGAGSVVVKDIPPGMLAYGVPARIIRKVAA